MRARINKEKNDFFAIRTIFFVFFVKKCVRCTFSLTFFRKCVILNAVEKKSALRERTHPVYEIQSHHF